MTDTPTTLVIPHVEASQFRSVFASGSIFSGPVDSSRNWILTFYSDGARVISECLVGTEIEGAFRNAEPPQIETERVRRDEVSVIIAEHQLAALVKALTEAMQETRK